METIFNIGAAILIVWICIMLIGAMAILTKVAYLAIKEEFFNQ